uniref:Uncharacterized protein n=1 Tax=Arundo donax TaxID=35708 RepID=A0A0A9EAZ2_ARUDO
MQASYLIYVFKYFLQSFSFYVRILFSRTR